MTSAYGCWVYKPVSQNGSSGERLTYVVAASLPRPGRVVGKLVTITLRSRVKRADVSGNDFGRRVSDTA